MRLKNITVSGFKSFVDVTKVSFTGELVGVVGPNGCGKSNVIDAVRWVMGESSAKMLRGDSMEDVIFNGSSSRKPVGRASVELLFDNSLGRIKSVYKDFAEIAIRRVLTRDGKSEYRINDKKVRRKDVIDLFRGTGLGPRSYSIIEQGMVSRIVEAKPEDLRSYVEEAAGISKYKDRRRETETRIRQTRENIERSEDIRSELLAQLRRLKRQAQAAERFKNLQARKREQMAVFFKLKELQIASQIDEDQKQLDLAINEFEKKVAQQRELESKIEASRAGHAQAQDDVNAIQAEFYEMGTAVSSLEQQIEHIKNTRAQRINELKEIEESLQSINEQLKIDQAKAEKLSEEVGTVSPNVEALNTQLVVSRETFANAQRELYDWQSELSEQTAALQSAQSKSQIQQSLINQLSGQQGRADFRVSQLQSEQSTLSGKLQAANVDTVKEALSAQEARIVEIEQQIIEIKKQLDSQSTKVQQTQTELADHRSLSQTYESRLSSLKEFQSASLSHADSEYQQWLAAQGLADAPVLAGQIDVASGWQRAADRVLSPYFQSVIDIDEQHPAWNTMPEQAITLLSAKKGSKSEQRSFGLPSLTEFIEVKNLDIVSLLSGYYAAKSLDQAQKYREQLIDGEVIVCQSGTMYGANWVSHASESAMNTGYLVREEEIASLNLQLAGARKGFATTTADLSSAQNAFSQLEAQLAQLRNQQREQGQVLSNKRNELTKLDSEHVHTQQRLGNIQSELHQIGLHQDEEQLKLSQAKQENELAQEQVKEIGSIKTKLDRSGDKLRERVTKEEEAHRLVQTKLHESNLLRTRIETEVNSVNTGLQRLQAQQSQLLTRKTSINEKLNDGSEPAEQFETQLQQKLIERQKIEARLVIARDSMAGHDNGLRELQGQLAQCVQEVNVKREGVEAIKLAHQGKQVRKESLVEEASREGYDTREVELEEEDLTIEKCEALVADLDRKISSVGAVNLVAIEEYETQSERAEYLEKQHLDLAKALDTLEQVIRKIDKETRVRFEETYTALEKSFSNYFPKLFGGGRASLVLTNDDWLTTGITVVAQPPGKRNSTIHLLSGGEKALTAVALLFALFELNPAPFCMMDEVDAPLDDANVERFCDTLKTLSQRAQIIVITHNKITMQVANSLIGVTMNEPGVSRVVSVDVDQALKMVD